MTCKNKTSFFILLLELLFLHMRDPNFWFSFVFTRITENLCVCNVSDNLVRLVTRQYGVNLLSFSQTIEVIERSRIMYGEHCVRIGIPFMTKENEIMNVFVCFIVILLFSYFQDRESEQTSDTPSPTKRGRKSAAAAADDTNGGGGDEERKSSSRSSSGRSSKRSSK